MRLPLLASAFAAALTAFILAGCGSGGDEGDGGGAGETIEIVETDFKLDPDTATVDAPGTYTFHVVNNGGTVHALEVEGHGLEEETDDLDPGSSADLTVEITESGEYELYCPVDGHREQGMEGTLVVRGEAGGATTGEDTTTDEDTTTEDETTTEEDDGGGGGYGYR